MMPVYPGANATPEALALYAVEMDRYKAESARIHAQAQADTAVAMRQMAAAQDRMTGVIGARVLPTRTDLIWDLTKVQPQASILTPSQIVAGAAQIVDAYIKANPGAVL
jgi:hypothetical protein